jgi:hypothetical protein
MRKLCGLLLLSFLCVAAAGQEPASKWEMVKALAPGTQVRVVAGASLKPLLGTLDIATDSELVVRLRTGPQPFPRAQIMAISVRKSKHRLRNTFIGLGVGVGAGLLIGYGVGRAQQSGCTKSGGWFCSLDTVGGAGVGGISGLVGGTVVGAFWPTGGWREIYVRSPEVVSR